MSKIKALYRNTPGGGHRIYISSYNVIHYFYGRGIAKGKDFFSVPFDYHTYSTCTSLGLEQGPILQEMGRIMFKSLFEPLGNPDTIVYGDIKPLPEQIPLIRGLFSKKFKCLFSDVGTGKTKMMLTVAANAMHNKIMIVTEHSLRWEWVSQSDFHTPWLKLSSYPDKVKTPSKRLRYLEGRPYIVVSYSSFTIPLIRDYLREWSPTLIILDESHNIKSEEAKTRFKLMHQLFYPKACFYMATATPTPKEYRDILTQYNLSYYNLPIKSMNWFVNKYYRTASGSKGDYPVPRKRAEGIFLKEIIKPYAGTCKLTSSVPELKRRALPVEMTVEQAEVYFKAEHQKIVEFEQRKQGLFNRLQTISYLARIATGTLKDPRTGEVKHYNITPRIDALNYIIKKHDDSQIIIWVQYRDVLLRLVDHYKDKYPLAYTMGGMDHTKAVNDFKTGKVHLLFGIYGTITTGHNLQQSNVVVNFTLPLEAKNLYQGEGRIRRTTQKRQPFSYILYSKGTVMERFYNKCMSRVKLNTNIHSLNIDTISDSLFRKIIKD